MVITKKKKIVVLVSMVALLVLTGFLNLTLNKQSTTTVSSSEIAYQNFFESFRVDRNNTRNEQMLYYKTILESENASTEAKQEAESALSTLASKQEKELVLEGYILAKGFEDTVVSFTENYVNVMVKAEKLNEQEVAQIVDVVQEQTGKSIDNIKIIPVE